MFFTDHHCKSQSALTEMLHNSPIVLNFLQGATGRQPGWHHFVLWYSSTNPNVYNFISKRRSITNINRFSKSSCNKVRCPAKTRGGRITKLSSIQLSQKKKKRKLKINYVDHPFLSELHTHTCPYFLWTLYKFANSVSIEIIFCVWSYLCFIEIFNRVAFLQSH